MPSKSTVVAAVLATSLLTSSAFACSRILWNTDQASVVARTMDLYMSDKARIAVFPRGMSHGGPTAMPNMLSWKSKYASVGATALDLAVSDGVNEWLRRALQAEGHRLAERAHADSGVSRSAVSTDGATIKSAPPVFETDELASRLIAQQGAARASAGRTTRLAVEPRVQTLLAIRRIGAAQKKRPGVSRALSYFTNRGWICSISISRRPEQGRPS